jgi:hypothetical protein
MSFRRFSSHLGKKGWEQFSAEKNLKIYGENRFRNIKKMAEKHFPIRIGIGIGKIDSKKCLESGIPADFQTKPLLTSSKNELRKNTSGHACSQRAQLLSVTSHELRGQKLAKVLTEVLSC